jgi:hypothetical protein
VSVAKTAAELAQGVWKWLLPASIALLAPLAAVLIATVVITVIDMILGVWAAMKRKEPITSRKLRRTIVKVFVYQSAIVLAYVVGHYMAGDLFPLARIISIAIGMVELKSCLENLNSISGADVLRAAIDKLNGGPGAKPQP